MLERLDVDEILFEEGNDRPKNQQDNKNRDIWCFINLLLAELGEYTEPGDTPFTWADKTLGGDGLVGESGGNVAL